MRYTWGMHRYLVRLWRKHSARQTRIRVSVRREHEPPPGPAPSWPPAYTGGEPTDHSRPGWDADY